MTSQPVPFWDEVAKEGRRFCEERGFVSYDQRKLCRFPLCAVF